MTRPETVGVFKVAAVVGFAGFMVQIDSSIVNVSLPTMAASLDAETGEMARVVVLYTAAVASSLLLCGRLADVVGRRRMFLAGLAVFTAASGACGLAASAVMLQAARFLQGLGGAMLYSTMDALVVENVPEANRGRVIGLLALVGCVGAAAGAPLGGFISTWLGWRWIFWVNLLPGAVALLLARRALAPGAANTGSERIDWTGAALAAGALLALLFAVNASHDAVATPARLMWGTAAAVGLGVTFIWHERHHPEPILSLTLFSDAALDAALAGRGAVILLLNGMMFLLPFMLTAVLGLAAPECGLLLGLLPLAAMTTTPIFGALTDRFPAWRIMAGGSAVLAADALVVGLLHAGTSPVVVGATLVVFGLALAAAMTACSKIVLGRMPATRLGSASAVNALVLFGAAALGVATFEAVFATVAGGNSFAELSTDALAHAFHVTMWLGVALAGGALASALALPLLIRRADVSKP